MSIRGRNLMVAGEYRRCCVTIRPRDAEKQYNTARLWLNYVLFEVAQKLIFRGPEFQSEMLSLSLINNGYVVKNLSRPSGVVCFDHHFDRSRFLSEDVLACCYSEVAAQVRRLLWSNQRDNEVPADKCCQCLSMLCERSVHIGRMSAFASSQIVHKSPGIPIPSILLE